MRTKLNEIIKNGHLGMIAVFFIVYMITFSYIEDRDVHHYIIHTTIDDQIPFCEYFIVPYLLWFLFVAVTVFYFMFFNFVSYIFQVASNCFLLSRRSVGDNCRRSTFILTV